MERMMDAIVKPAAGPGLELRRVPVPVPGPGEVLIRIHKTAICGTDVHIYDWNEWAAQHVRPPMIIGHEYVGEIAALGAGVMLTDASADGIRRAVSTALTDPAYRENARKLADSFRRCGGAAEAADAIEHAAK